MVGSGAYWSDPRSPMCRQTLAADRGVRHPAPGGVRFSRPLHLTAGPPDANYVNVINIHME